MFWHYAQSNPRGKYNDKYSMHVIIEAESPQEANEIASTKAGLYWYPECECCDTRWEMFKDNDTDMGDKYPSIFGEPYDNCEDDYILGDTLSIYYKNGDIEITTIKGE